MKRLFQLLRGSRRRVKEADRLLQMAGEGGSHTHCVVAVMGRMDFWLRDYYRTPESWVHPLPRHQVSRPSRSPDHPGFAHGDPEGVSYLCGSQKTPIFLAVPCLQLTAAQIAVVELALVILRSSSAAILSFGLGKDQTVLSAVQKQGGKSSSALFQCYPNGSSGSRKAYPKVSSHGAPPPGPALATSVFSTVEAKADRLAWDTSRPPAWSPMKVRATNNRWEQEVGPAHEKPECQWETIGRRRRYEGRERTKPQQTVLKSL